MYAGTIGPASDPIADAIGDAELGNRTQDTDRLQYAIQASAAP